MNEEYPTINEEERSKLTSKDQLNVKEKLSVEQIVAIVAKINDEITDCDDLSAIYQASVVVVPDSLGWYTSYISIEFPFAGNTVWHSEDDENTEEAIRTAIYNELKTIYYNFNLMVKHLNLCD